VSFRAAAAKNPGSFSRPLPVRVILERSEESLIPSSPLPVRERIEVEGTFTARVPRAIQDSAGWNEYHLALRAASTAGPIATSAAVLAKFKLV
jgi:hypothetical protein